MKDWLLAELIGGPAAGMHVWVECPTPPDVKLPVRTEAVVPVDGWYQRRPTSKQLVYKRVANYEPGPFVPYYYHEIREA